MDGLRVYLGWRRAWSKILSLLVGGGFERFGTRTVITPPFQISGGRRIRIGDGVYIGMGSILRAMEHPENPLAGPIIEINENVSVAGTLTISAVRSVVLEKNALLAQNIYISDHAHRYVGVSRPIKEQGIEKIAAVRIGEGAWLGHGAVIFPGVQIGAGAVVGSNSVVKSNVPEFSVAVGSPARIVKTFGIRRST